MVYSALQNNRCLYPDRLLAILPHGNFLQDVLRLTAWTVVIWHCVLFLNL